jgi:hypothetical protein
LHQLATDARSLTAELAGPAYLAEALLRDVFIA